MKSKAVIPLYVVALLLLVLVLFLVLLKFQLKVQEKIVGKPSDRCRLSIERAKFFLAKEVPQLECSTQNVTISSFKDASRQIAQEVHECYTLFANAGIFTQEGRSCFLCATFQFVGAEQQSIPDFYTYLFTQKPLKSQKTYALHWFGETATPPQYSVLTRQDYALVFVHDQGEKSVTAPFIPIFSDTFKRSGQKQYSLISEGFIASQEQQESRDSFVLTSLAAPPIDLLKCTRLVQQKPL